MDRRSDRALSCGTPLRIAAKVILPAGVLQARDSGSHDHRYPFVSEIGEHQRATKLGRARHAVSSRAGPRSGIVRSGVGLRRDRRLRLRLHSEVLEDNVTGYALQSQQEPSTLRALACIDQQICRERSRRTSPLIRLAGRSAEESLDAPSGMRYPRTARNHSVSQKRPWAKQITMAIVVRGASARAEEVKSSRRRYLWDVRPRWRHQSGGPRAGLAPPGHPLPVAARVAVGRRQPLHQALEGKEGANLLIVER